MKSVNKVTILGTLGREPDTKFTPSGTAVSKLSVATNEKYKDKSGEWNEKTEWHSIVLWGKLAELAGQYLHKGSRVLIEGKLGTSSWTDQGTGEKKYRTEITAVDLILIDGKESQGTSKAEDESQDVPF